MKAVRILKIISIAIALLSLLLLATSCTKRHEDALMPNSTKDKDIPTADEVGMCGIMVYKKYIQNNAEASKKALLLFIDYLNEIKINSDNSDEVFSNKAMTLARLEYVNHYLSGTPVDWSEPVALLKKTSHAQEWKYTNLQAEYEMKQILADNDAKYVNWINRKEILQGVPEHWLNIPQEEPKNDNEYHKQLMINRFMSEYEKFYKEQEGATESGTAEWGKKATPN